MAKHSHTVDAFVHAPAADSRFVSFKAVAA